MIRTCREYLVNVTPIIFSLEEKGMTEKEIIAWFEENNPDSSVNAALYYVAKKRGLANPMTVPIDKLNMEDYE
ncbi:MAG: hypothetical protein DRJ13_10085 [Bacteroidetes bacterium]|nr:MAG: hypothetical protein DRJ13_10085 [Bacteroidota bacterium]